MAQKLVTAEYSRGDPLEGRPADSHALRSRARPVDDIDVWNDTFATLGFTLDQVEIVDFWSRVHLPADLADRGPCWLYAEDAVGDRGRYGHVRIRVAGGRRVFVHRLAFALTGGVLTLDNDIVIHGCDVPPCASPHHLRAGNHLQNARDRDLRGRRSPFLPRGEDSPSAKLTEREVQAMLRARQLGVPARTLAEAFGVSLATVYARTGGRQPVAGGGPTATPADGLVGSTAQRTTSGAGALSRWSPTGRRQPDDGRALTSG